MPCLTCGLASLQAIVALNSVDSLQIGRVRSASKNVACPASPYLEELDYVCSRAVGELSEVTGTMVMGI